MAGFPMDSQITATARALAADNPMEGLAHRRLPRAPARRIVSAFSGVPVSGRAEDRLLENPELDRARQRLWAANQSPIAGRRSDHRSARRRFRGSGGGSVD
jgi:hypothetical protein